MPRGRPRKNPLPEVEEENSQSTINKNPPPSTEIKNPLPDTTSAAVSAPSASIPSFLSPSEYDKLPFCDRCHEKIISGEKNINLTILTAMASWHRDVNKDRICLCTNCAKELNKVIDEFLLNNGKGMESKWNKME